MAEEQEVEDLIRYDVLAQEALRGVVAKVLQEVARTGLPGDHHFYVTFDTTFAGVRMSSRMREKHPEEMTIVVQHQFWDLEANDNNFSIGLSFGGVPENLLVPYAAITGFFDPSVQFGLQFDSDAAQDEPSMPEVGHTPVSALPAPARDQQDEVAQTGKASDGSDAEGAEDSSADVVSLDAFRKK